MSPRKLTNADREEIIQLYRTTEETTSTLAIRYGVSSSTISRFLKNYLSEVEYEDLIQQKRLARTPHKSQQQTIQGSLDFDSLSFSGFRPDPETEQKDLEKQKEDIPVFQPPERKSSATDAETEQKDLEKQKEDIPVFQPPFREGSPTEAEDKIPQKEIFVNEQDSFFQQILGEDILDLDDEDDLDDENELDEDWEDEQNLPVIKPLPKQIEVKVLPLSQASFPKICYLVIDRTGELITKPLKEFADLGKIPLTEFQQKTLPVFDNQRVARRFSNRSQKVIKVPDSRVIEKTCPYLKAKGITRLLIDGQVYSLSSLLT
jgi:transposase-like protein